MGFCGSPWSSPWVFMGPHNPVHGSLWISRAQSMVLCGIGLGYVCVHSQVHWSLWPSPRVSSAKSIGLWPSLWISKAEAKGLHSPVQGSLWVYAAQSMGVNSLVHGALWVSTAQSVGPCGTVHGSLQLIYIKCWFFPTTSSKSLRTARIDWLADFYRVSNKQSYYQ